jgi:fructokinase
MSAGDEIYGAIEGGGTKVVCALGNARGELLESTRIVTGTPQRTLGDVFEYFAAAKRRAGPLRALGVGWFGPLELRIASPQFGYVSATPKPGWSRFDLHGTLSRHFNLPVYLDTDVNVAALAENRWGAARELKSMAYVTVGTGIGAGLIQHGLPVHGLMHPEFGHVMVRRHAEDTFAGVCPFHGDCLEGLACGPAIRARIGRPLNEAPPDHPIWSIEADYLGQLAALLALTHASERIVMGGGVMENAALLPATRIRMLAWLAGYLAPPEIGQRDYLCAPALGRESGIRGALALALATTPD